MRDLRQGIPDYTHGIKILAGKKFSLAAAVPFLPD